MTTRKETIYEVFDILEKFGANMFITSNLLLYDEITVSYPDGSIGYLDEKGKALVEEFEHRYNRVVYHIILEKSKGHYFIYFLYWANDKSLWESDCEAIFNPRVLNEKKSVFRAYRFDFEKPYVKAKRRCFIKVDLNEKQGLMFAGIPQVDRMLQKEQCR